MGASSRLGRRKDGAAEPVFSGDAAVWAEEAYGDNATRTQDRFSTPQFVIPAKAGISQRLYPHEIPAFGE
jgi:hypothetical protein